MPSLLITAGPETGREIDVPPGGIVIGRQAGVDVLLMGANVSRRHARVFLRDGAVMVEDLGSSNGTTINDKPVKGPQLMGVHDTLRLGVHHLRLSVAKSPDAEFTIHRKTRANLSNPELFSENAARKLQAVLELNQRLGRSLDTTELLTGLLDQLLVLFPQADRGMAIMIDRGNPALRMVRTRGPARSGATFSRSIVREVVERGMALLAEDTQAEARFVDNATLSAIGIQSLMCVPLQDHAQRVFGALQLDRLQMGSPFQSEDLYLFTAIAFQVSLLLENAQLHADLLQQERMARELEMARNIQLGFLPHEPLVLPSGRVDIYGVLHPALEVSGDFYDYFAMDSYRVGFCVADVAGKGMPAALFMSKVQAIGRHVAHLAEGPGDWLIRWNRAVATDNPQFMFVTVACGIYDSTRGFVHLAYAGHPPGLFRRRDGRVSSADSRPAPLLGVDLEFPPPAELVLELDDGDAVVLYTDGATESPSAPPGAGMFGPERLAATVAGLPDRSPLPIWADQICEAVHTFSKGSTGGDDLTLLLLRHGGAPS